MFVMQLPWAQTGHAGGCLCSHVHTAAIMSAAHSHLMILALWPPSGKSTEFASHTGCSAASHLPCCAHFLTEHSETSRRAGQAADPECYNLVRVLQVKQVFYLSYCARTLPERSVTSRRDSCRASTFCCSCCSRSRCSSSCCNRVRLSSCLAARLALSTCSDRWALPQA